MKLKKHALHFLFQIAVFHLCPSGLGTMVQGEVRVLRTNEPTSQLSSNSALENICKTYLGLHQSSSFASSRLLGWWT